MCGRIVDYLTDREIVELYHVAGGKRLGVEHQPNYNLKPTQTIRAVRLDEHRAREIAEMRWGFVPTWSKELPKQAWINAKVETMEQPRSMWKPALKARRCLVPVNGFYEWTTPEKGPKQPYFIHLADGKLMTFAGIWETWQPKDGEPMESLAVATCAPSKEFSVFHDRQVVILRDQDEQDAWLDPDTPPEAALMLLRPLRAGLLQFRSVGRAVNIPGNHGPDCIEERKINAPAKSLWIKRPTKRNADEAKQGRFSKSSPSALPPIVACNRAVAVARPFPALRKLCRCRPRGRASDCKPELKVPEGVGHNRSDGPHVLIVQPTTVPSARRAVWARSKFRCVEIPLVRNMRRDFASLPTKATHLRRFMLSRLVRRFLGLVSLVLCLVLNRTKAASFQGLGDVPGGSFSSRALAISGDGANVVGQGRTLHSQASHLPSPNVGLPFDMRTVFRF